MAAGDTSTGIAAKIAIIVFQRKERMFQPRLPNLFEPFGIIRSATHSIKILRDDRMIGIG